MLSGNPCLRRAARVLALAAGLGPSSAADPAAVVRGEQGAKLDQYMTRLEGVGYSGGLTVVRAGETVLRKGYGLADREAGRPMKPDSVFNIGSITKPFTAAAILRLQELGKLKTSDPIERHFEGVPADKAGITLEHLLTHSSGIESDFSPSDYEPTTREEYAARALASKLLFPPGQGYEYSNAGYSLLAAVVEKTTGKSYEEALAELVLRPAGMSETGYRLPGWAEDRLARGRREGKDWGTILSRIQEPGAPFWALRGNGGLHTTLADMARWDQALQGDAVLSAASRESYFRPRVLEGPGASSHYSFGWAVEDTPHGRLVQHNGGNGVHIAEFLRFVDQKTMIFLTSTVSELTASQAISTVTRIVFGESYDLPPATVALPGSALAARVGRYTAPGGAEVRVAAEDQTLLLSAANRSGFALLHPVPEPDRARAEKLQARTADIAGRGYRGDYSGVHEALGGRLTLDELRERQGQLRREREARLGAFRGFEPIGAVAQDEGRLSIWVRLEFEKGATYDRFVWGAKDRLLGIRTSEQPPADRYVPVSATDAAPFTLGAGSPGVHASFDVNQGGGLAIRGPGGEVKLTRGR